MNLPGEPLDAYIQSYYNYRWDIRKSAWLKAIRGHSFEEVLAGRCIGQEDHPRRGNQVYLLFELEDYIWAIPAVLEDAGFFLKTLFPSRKHTRKYLA